jgi:hypothetical protein
METKQHRRRSLPADWVDRVLADPSAVKHLTGVSDPREDVRRIFRRWYQGSSYDMWGEKEARAQELTIKYGRCIACGRKLYVSESVKRGMGPQCRKKWFIQPTSQVA